MQGMTNDSEASVRLIVKHVIERQKLVLKAELYESTFFLLSKATNQSKILLQMFQEDNAFGTCI